MALVAVILLLLSGNTEVLPAVEAGGGDGQEGCGGGGAGHRTGLARQQEAPSKKGKTTSKQRPANDILQMIFAFCGVDIIIAVATSG